MMVGKYFIYVITYILIHKNINNFPATTNQLIQYLLREDQSCVFGQAKTFLIFYYSSNIIHVYQVIKIENMIMFFYLYSKRISKRSVSREGKPFRLQFRKNCGNKRNSCRFIELHFKGNSDWRSMSLK